MMLIATPVYAGSVSIEFPDEQRDRILAGLTQSGDDCIKDDIDTPEDEAEAIGVCAKRHVARLIKQAVRQYERLQARRIADQGVTEADIT